MGLQTPHTTQRFGDALLPHQPDPTARAVTLSVNPRQRRGHTRRHTCAAERRRWHTPALHLQRHRPAVHISSSSLPGRCPGLTESGSALRTSSSTLAIPAPLHRRHPDRASGLVTPSPPTSALIVAERRHSDITRYAERSAVCRDSTRPCCRRAGGTPLLQSRCPTARAVTSSVNPRQRRGHTHRRTCAAERRR